ncbi:MAG: response regulator [Magnetococcales bacterium]|nr:response regulator [Magnetococcales bacterium]MBF0415057.1 response regulator [Magnetococcales bacterium]
MTSSILIVDDEPINLAALSQILSPEYTLVFARNGIEALTSAAKHHPALILLDVIMPEMDGYTVCRRLKADPQTENIPVIFVTSLAEVGHESSGFAAGAVDYMIKPMSPTIVKARVRTHLSLVNTKQLERSYNDAIHMLGEASKFKDTDTGVHIWRMAAYSSALASACGWNIEACQQLELAAPMHDIGKLGIPDIILRKPAKLNAAEWNVMKTHTSIGHDILSLSMSPLLQMAATIALSHHEKWDGGGYPQGLVGAAIPEMARIIAVADVFDALSMERPYKEAWPLDRVMETLASSAGTHLDPRMIECFTNILPDILEIQKRWVDHDFNLDRLL